MNRKPKLTINTDRVKVYKACSWCGDLIPSKEGISSPKYKDREFCNKQHLEKFEESK